MKLLDHLKATDERIETFAERIDEPVSTIRKIAYRQRQPSLPLAVKIEAMTGGAVQPADMLLDNFVPNRVAICPRCEELAESGAVASCTSIHCPMQRAVAA